MKALNPEHAVTMAVDVLSRSKNFPVTKFDPDVTVVCAVGEDFKQAKKLEDVFPDGFVRMGDL